MKTALMVSLWPPVDYQQQTSAKIQNHCAMHVLFTSFDSDSHIQTRSSVLYSPKSLKIDMRLSVSS